MSLAISTTVKRYSAEADVLTAGLTPLTSDLEPDISRLIRHCQWLLDNGSDGLSLLGTTGEENSLDARQRMHLLEQCISGGVHAQRTIPGTGACALKDAVALTRHAVSVGCAGVLLLPRFYYKAITNDGLFLFFSALMENVADDRLRVLLYYIFPVSGVALLQKLIERLSDAYPGIVVGLKDSGGDWAYTENLLQALPQLRIFSGSEALLLQNLRVGGAGCISVTADLTAPLAQAVKHVSDEPAADTLQNSLTNIRRAIETLPVIPALKFLLSKLDSDPDWATVLPPLIPLDGAKGVALVETLKSLPEATATLAQRGKF